MHPRRRRLGLPAVLAILAVSLPLGAPSAAPRGRADDAVTLKVGTFNIEYGGTVVDFDRIVAAVRASDADVLGIEEAWGHIPRLARAAGWPYYDVRTAVISRHPIWDPPEARGRYVLVEPSPGRFIAVQNVHLPSAPYGPNRAMRGATRSELVALERDVRLPAVRPFLTAAKDLIARDVPVFLVGDFNAPSHRDWTDATVGMRPQVVFPVPWPVSRAVERVGFQDSYRVAHPDPVRDPGLTWWAGRPKVEGEWNPGRNAPQDRIDLVYAAGATTEDSIVMGEAGHPDVDLEIDPWGTDHRAVVSTFSVIPADAGPTVSVDRRLTEAGDRLTVRTHGGVRLTVVHTDGAGVAADRAVPPGAPVELDTSGWVPGAYRAGLIDATGTALASTKLWIAAPGAAPTISTSKETYAVGEGIEVSWTGVRGDRWDWIGIYRRNADPAVAWYLLWIYSDARVAGTAVLDQASVGGWPLEPGRYRVYILRDDGYRPLAGADFDIA
jgi:endonuclease/exonuclease/phosphatase family metal-dependent hydrolase